MGFQYVCTWDTVKVSSRKLIMLTKQADRGCATEAVNNC
jgi:hypothetical protein